MTEPIKCAVTERVLTPCNALRKALEGDYQERRKGLSLIEIVNLTTLKTAYTAAVLRSGEHAKKGIVINYCPFCGAAIAEHITTKPEQAQQQTEGGREP